MKPLLVVDVVGLTPGLIGRDTPHLWSLAREGFQAEIETVLPAVTSSVQATFLTGSLPRHHGIVGNGWYFRDLSEVRFWRQSNRLVRGEKVWERGRARDSGFTCAKMFWWFNMYSTADWAVTPRPIYRADGRKIPGVYTKPPELGQVLQRELGTFPLLRFWGPGADITSSEWIARASRWVLERYRPTLTLVYLPHLDYDFQRYGPEFDGAGAQLRAIDQIVGGLIDLARQRDMDVVILSEYGITSVRASISLNRVLRREGFLALERTLHWELLDAGASRAFAACDHQVAHVYVRDPADSSAVRRCLEGIDGVEHVLDREAQAVFGLDHDRSGEFVCVARRDCWFDYYYWLDDSLAPDFAPTVDIHRKPGYDPAELFLDPKVRWIRLKILSKLLKKKLGFRCLMDVVPTTSELVRGSHGRLPDTPSEGPVLISSSRREARSRLAATEIADLLLETIFG